MNCFVNLIKVRTFFPVSVIFILVLFILNCGKSKTLEVIQEPVVDQISVYSPEICLDSYVWVIPANPCIYLKAEKDNTSLKKRYLLVYELSSFDVEFPLGVSIEVDGEYHNLVKVATDYGSTLELVSSISTVTGSKISKSKKIRISYTNRKETRNYDLTDSQVEDLKSYLAELQELLKKEPKMKIKRQ